MTDNDVNIVETASGLRAHLIHLGQEGFIDWIKAGLLLNPAHVGPRIAGGRRLVWVAPHWVNRAGESVLVRPHILTTTSTAD